MAGEIQLNSTTMATESSGSITAELDTIRPNTTNGSLTLQGDSSNAGVTGLTIDSSGNATFAQTISGGTIGSGVVFPAGHMIGYNYHLKTTTQTINHPSTNTGTVITFDTNPTTSLTANGSNSLFEITASISFGQQEAIYPAFFMAYSTDGSTFTDILGPTNGNRTRVTMGGQYGAEETNEDVRLFNVSMTWVVSPTLSSGSTFYYQVRGTDRPLGSAASLLINSSWDNTNGNQLTGVSSLICREISQ